MPLKRQSRSRLSNEARMHLEKVSGDLGMEFMSLAQERVYFREISKVLSRPRREVGRVEDVKLPGPAGEVPVRLYWPEGAAPEHGLAAIVYVHGGGWTVGDIETHDELVREICARTGILMCSVDYRLAPEHKFPAAVEDCCAAVRWLIEHASEIGIDPDRIGVAGESAGGNIAAGVAIAAKDDASLKLAGQFLHYPSTCVVETFTTPSRTDLGGDGSFYPSMAQINVVADHYIATPTDRLNPMVSPLLAEDLSNIAPAVIGTAGFDPLRDEARMYADRLREFGVDVTYKCFETTIHGYLNFGKDLPDASDEGFQFFVHTAKKLLLR